MAKKTVFITGASSGIGAALAFEYAKRGFQVVLFARRADRLEEMRCEIVNSGGSAVVCVGDVTRQADLDAAVEKALETYGALDTVIANAGFGVVGEVAGLSMEDFERQFSVNVWGVLRTVWATRKALEASRGKLGVIGSVTGYISLPGNTPYSMSKFAVRALCDGLRLELLARGVSVTHIAPGFIVSEIRRVTNHGELRPNAHDRVPMWIQMPASLAARKIASATERRKRERVVTAHGKILVWLARFFPGSTYFLLKILGVAGRSEPGSRLKPAENA